MSTDTKMLFEQLNDTNDKIWVVKLHNYSCVQPNIKILRYN